MSMYSELLTASLAAQPNIESERGTPSHLLAHLMWCRQRLEGSVSRSRREPEVDLAANLDYDVALLRLCTARGIDSEPGRFAIPLLERRRLEMELRECGINLEILGRGEEVGTQP
jgi:hypothetical protein